MIISGCFYPKTVDSIPPHLLCMLFPKLTVAEGKSEHHRSAGEGEGHH